MAWKQPYKPFEKYVGNREETLASIESKLEVLMKDLSLYKLVETIVDSNVERFRQISFATEINKGLLFTATTAATHQFGVSFGIFPNCFCTQISIKQPPPTQFVLAHKLV